MSAQFLTGATGRLVFERYLTRREEKTFLAHIARHSGAYARRDHAWIRLARFAGLRVGTLGGLTVADARGALAEKRLRIRAEIAKGHRAYDVPLSLQAQQALRDLLTVRRAMRLADDEDAPLICSRLGNALSERSFQHRMQMWRRSSGLAVDASPHWLRHTLAQRILETTESRDPLGVVQVALGHASRSSTVVYSLPNREQVAHALQAAAA